MVVTLQGVLVVLQSLNIIHILIVPCLFLKVMRKETDEYFWAYTIQQKFEIEKEKHLVEQLRL